MRDQFVRLKAGNFMATKSVLSNVDLIKKFVFEKQPVTLNQIVDEVMAQMSSVNDAQKARDRYVLPVLTGQPYYREEDGKWTIIREEMPEYKILREVFADEHRLMYEREVRSKVAKALKVKAGTVVLDLELASGLQKIGSHWGLDSWVIANDYAAEVLDEHPGGLTEKDLAKTVSERYDIDPENTILHLKGDKKKRFIAERKQWLLKEHYDKKQAEAKDPTLTLPELKTGTIDQSLEVSFLSAHDTKPETGRKSDNTEGRARLKKALKKQAQEVLEQREQASQQEDLATKLSQVLSAAGIEDYDVSSYQQVEAAPKEHGLTPKERDDIQSFIDKLLEQETVGVGAPVASVINAPLSARKVVDVLRLKYIDYTRDRAVLPAEYYRFAVEIMQPTINDTVIHPSCFDGLWTVELLNYLFDKLEGAAWALTDENSALEIVQPDGSRYQLSPQDAALLEKARDKFLVSQVDLVNYFLQYKYTGIEADSVLAKAARIVTRLTGYESAYIDNRDYLTELPEIFNYPPNEDNDIPDRFDYVFGNLTFTVDANLAANYLDQSLQMVGEDGYMMCFVLVELMELLKQHGLLGEFLQGMGVTHYIKLPVIEGRHQVVLLGVTKLIEGDNPPLIVNAEVADFKTALSLSNALRTSTGEGEKYKLVDQMALVTLIG